MKWLIDWKFERLKDYGLADPNNRRLIIERSKESKIGYQKIRLAQIR